MSEQKTIREFYEKDHGRLDELFKTFQQLKRSHPPKAKGVFEEFKFGLERHIVWEEDLLFPLWEKKTGRSEEGPTVVMQGSIARSNGSLKPFMAKCCSTIPTAIRRNRRYWTYSVPIIGRKNERCIPPSIRWPVRKIAKLFFAT